jgi:DHA2 family multidrug resistance protein
VITFVISIIMLATSALLPPYLQNLGGYSVISTGLLLAPRGAGTMIAMFLLGRIVMKIDVRMPIAAGFAILLWSMWAMSVWTPAIDAWSLGVTSFIQGVGIGLIFIPSNVMGFSTLPAHLRTDASAFLNLVRNVAAALGVSVSTTFLESSADAVHATLASHVNMFNRALAVNAPSMIWNPQLPSGLAQIEAIIQRNAQIVAYSDVFRIMFFVCLPSVFLVFLLKKPPIIGGKAEIEIVEA